MAVKIDAITLEVMRNALQSIAEEMGVTLVRTALSPNIKDRRDCSTAIYNANGELVAQAEHIPLHLGLMPTVIKEVLKVFPREDLEPGDAIIINDPYISGSHLPDVCIFSPVFNGKEMVAIVANLAHHVDIGGMAPGGMPVNSTEIFQEGIRISPVKICKKGKINHDILNLLLNNVRTSFEFKGDLEAQLAANNVGVRRMGELAQKYDSQFLMVYMEEIMNYSERRMRSKIKDMGVGEYFFEDYMEGNSSKDKITIKANVKVNEDNVLVDFTGSSPQVEASLNSTRAVTLACVYYAIKAMADPEVPPNEGAFRPINVVTPLGTVVNPKFPAPVSNANINTAQRITDVILGALAKAKPERVMAACSGTMSLFTIGGIDPRTDKYYSYVETYGGGMGAVRGSDGMDGVHTNMTNTRNTPAEVMEISYPLLVEEYGLLSDTDGPGKYRGGLGLYRKVKILDHDANVTLSTERGEIKPWGLFGGRSGSNSACLLIDSQGDTKTLPTKITTKVSSGYTIVYQTPGAGGYENPFLREPDKVLHDVLEGLVSVERAYSEYGVVIDLVDEKVDYERTEKLRKKLNK